MNAESLTVRRVPLRRRLLDNIRNHPLLYLLALPVAAYYIIFCYLPMYGVVIAFQDFKPALGIAGSRWVGLKHFEKLVTSRYFGRLLGNTLSINLGMLLVGFPLPILFALLLNEIPSRGFQRVTQTITYMPHFISTVVICGLMVQFCSSNGILTNVLSHLGMQKTNLFTVPRYFQPLYIGMNIWQNLGWDSIIYFAALAGVDSELYEAAQIDGAGPVQVVTKIVLPLARPSIIVTALMVLIYVWNEYIYATTFMTGEENYTLAAGLYALQATEMSGSWPVFAAAAITVSVPVLIIFFLCQKYMTSGLTAGGVKG